MWRWQGCRMDSRGVCWHELYGIDSRTPACPNHVSQYRIGVHHISGNKIKTPNFSLMILQVGPWKPLNAPLYVSKSCRDRTGGVVVYWSVMLPVVPFILERYSFFLHCVAPMDIHCIVVTYMVMWCHVQGWHVWIYMDMGWYGWVYGQFKHDVSWCRTLQNHVYRHTDTCCVIVCTTL